MCICEQPMRRPISAWVRSSRKRRCTTSASRSDNVASRPSSVAVASAAAKPESSAPSRSASVSASSPPSGGEWAVEGVAAAGPGGFGGVEDVFDRAVEPLGKLGGGGIAPEVGCELLAIAFDAQSALLEVAWWADRPAAAAEVASDLALDGRHRERAKGGAVVGVKAVQCLDQTECRDLLQVLKRHPVAAVKAPRDRIRERQIGASQAFTGVRVAVLRISAKVCRLVAALSPSSGAVVRRHGGSRRREGHGTDVLPGTGSSQTRITPRAGATRPRLRASRIARAGRRCRPSRRCGAPVRAGTRPPVRAPGVRAPHGLERAR